jgi:hypothetical protein
MSVATRVDGDHFELPTDALELLPGSRDVIVVQAAEIIRRP